MKSKEKSIWSYPNQKVYMLVDISVIALIQRMLHVMDI